MATIEGNKIRLTNGKLVTPQTGGWYDGQQFWNGSLSNAGQINSQSNQQGAGQMVSPQVNQQTSIAQGKDPNANQDYINRLNNVVGNTQPIATGGGSAGGTADLSVGQMGTVPVVGPTPNIDLPGLYNTLYNSAGISTLEQQLADKAKAYTEAQSKINDNPFLSEASRVGRAQKLNLDYNNNIKNDQDLMAMRKADIETQLNLQSKQFDITSQAARDSLDRFNTLLKLGSLDNASGEDIANITRSTGLSSQAIQSAIDSKKMGDLTTEVKAYDDKSSGETGFVVYTFDKQGNVTGTKKIPTGKSTSSVGGWSADPAVNNFISSLMQPTTQGSDETFNWGD